jgi:hypothetical protein
LTVIEVVVAASLVIVGGLAVLGVVDAATRNNFRAQQTQVLNDRLQSEMEKVKQLPYGQIALTAAPTSSADSANPNSRVSGTTFALSAGGANPQALAYNGGASHDQGQTLVSGGTVSPGPTPFQTGNVSGNVYRYVTWQQDSSCAGCGQPWFKHVTVVITLTKTGAGGGRTYQEIQSDVSDGSAGGQTGGPSGGGTNAKPWTFWLTDTPCNFNSRQPITADHATHNTRGICSAGQKSGNSPGAPDLMFTQAPPCANNDCSTTQPLYDYATDVEPAQNPANDRGIQLRNGPGCGALQSVWGTLPLTADLFDTSYFQKIHKWLSPPIPNGYDILFNGTGALDLWTESLNGAVGPGKICVYLFYRQVTLGIGGIQIIADTPAVNLDVSNLTHFTYSQNPWPTTWTEIHIPLHFSLGAHLLPGTQLGVALGVDSSGTGPSGLEFLYDAPSFDSRLQVQTTSILPF